jgi:outer membrane biosynthesis protein TonB
MTPTPRLKRALIMLSCASLLLAFGALASGETADALLRRYPYDPACPLGRIGNGKGLIVRCLTETEAQGLRSGTLAFPAASSTASGAPVVAAPPNSATPTPVAPDVVADADAGAPTPAPSDDKLEITVGPVTADTGTLGIGKLGAARDKYLKCVNDNGGLKEASGEVQVRFMLRERGRAEGVSVAKRSGVSAEAARCVSEVVDRRYVGVPAEPIVGATVVIKFVKAAK